MKHRGELDFLRGRLVSIFGSYLFTALEIINRKRKISKVFISIIFVLLFITGFAQETHNLEIIWTKTASPSVWWLGGSLSSCDLNGDGFSDIVITGDSLYGGDTWTHKAYVFYGGLQFDTIPDLIITRPESLGFHIVVCIRDITGDGFDDLVLGSQHLEEVSIFLGGNPMDTICDYKIKGRNVGSIFGNAIASGNVNGDSFGDLIVGAYGYGNLQGRVYVYFGGPNFDTIPDVILNGGHDGQFERFGIQVGSGGDVNNDGKEDVIIGADGYGTSFWGNGRIYIYYGGNPMDTSYDVAMTGEVPNQSLGWTPKVNLLKTELEYDMAVFGSEFWHYGFPRVGPGKVYVLFGGNPMDSIPDVWMIGRTDSTGLGVAVSNTGFVNQTNSEGIISGAPQEYNSFGSTYLWLGGALLDTTPDAWLRGMQYDDGIGWMVASAGDIDKDGRDEIMVSNYATHYTPKRVWVCKYTDTGIEGRPPIVNRLPLEVKPNPVKTQAAIRFSLSAESRVSLIVYNITGTLVKTICANQNILKSGNYEMRWDLRDDNQKNISTGIYFLKMTVDNGQEIIRDINKIVVTR